MSKHYVKRYISTLPCAHDRTGNDIVVRATNVLLIVKQVTRVGGTEEGGSATQLSYKAISVCLSKHVRIFRVPGAAGCPFSRR